MEKIILAPHVDDEIIGCYSLLKNSKITKVIYFYDLTDERKEEALKIGKFFEHEVSFNGFEEKISQNAIIYIPSKFDYHPHHYKIYQYGQILVPGEKIFCYSVEKNLHCNLLSEEDRNFKLKVLNDQIPSQKELWASNMKYIIFELIYPFKDKSVGEEFYDKSV